MPVFRRLRRGEKGSGKTEYIVISTFIAISAIAVASVLGFDLRQVGATVDNALAGNFSGTESQDETGICANGSCNCFVAGTPIDTAEGSKPIEEVALGERVGPKSAECAEVRLEEWAEVDLRIAVATAAGSDELELQLLRPDDWLRENRPVAGGRLALSLEEPRFTGEALVTGVRAAPPVKPGPRCPVTGLMRHVSPDVIAVAVQGGSTLEVTRHHRLFSADRNDWVAAGDLAAGEHLSTKDGVVEVEEVRGDRRGPTQVYNLEVFQAHRYFVGAQRVLAHNAGCDKKAKKGKGKRFNPLAASSSSSTSSTPSAPVVARVSPNPAHKVFYNSFDDLKYGSKNPDKVVNLNQNGALDAEHKRLADFEADVHAALPAGDKKKNLFATSFGVIATTDADSKDRVHLTNVHDMTANGTAISTSGQGEKTVTVGGTKVTCSAVPGSFGCDNKTRTDLMAGTPDSKSYDPKKAKEKAVSFTSTFDHSEHADWARLDAAEVAASIDANAAIPPGSKIHAVTYNGHTTRYTCRNCEHGMHNLTSNSAIFRQSLTQELKGKGYRTPKDDVRLIPIVSAHEWTNPLAKPNSNPPATRTRTEKKDSKPDKKKYEYSYEVDHAAFAEKPPATSDVKELAKQGKFPEVVPRPPAPPAPSSPPSDSMDTSD